MPFVVGESYTRDYIHAELGGEKVSYLPQQAGRIVCGCFSTESNPEAPYVILVGGSDEEGTIRKKARILVRQDGPIPVFLKQAANNWMFDSYYRVKGFSKDAALLSRKQAAAGRDGVVMALFLEPVASPTFAVFLMTWNPGQWAWTDIEDAAQRTAVGQPVALLMWYSFDL